MVDNERIQPFDQDTVSAFILQLQGEAIRHDCAEIFRAKHESSGWGDLAAATRCTEEPCPDFGKEKQSSTQRAISGLA
jgi:hypothetical protein